MFAHSIQTLIGSTKISTTPAIGMIASMYCANDSKLVEIKTISRNSQKIKVQVDDSPTEPLLEFSRRGNGDWVQVGYARETGAYLVIGQEIL